MKNENSFKDSAKNLSEVLSKTGIYCGLTTGISMEPLIHHQKDTIIVKKTDGRLKKYDIPVYVLKSGKVVMHRIVKVHDDYYDVYGDNTCVCEHVTDDMIVGKLVGFYKNGKKYIDLDNNKIYKFYSKVWVALVPLRPVTMFINRGIRFLKRKLLK